MSFTDLKITELRKIADSFAVDASTAKTKKELIAVLEEEGISYQMYDKFNNVKKEEIEIPEIEKKKREPKTVNKENKVLVKMNKSNHSFQAGPYVFTSSHPFVPMAESEAQILFDTYKGFSLATPREAQEFYS